MPCCLPNCSSRHSSLSYIIHLNFGTDGSERERQDHAAGCGHNQAWMLPVPAETSNPNLKSGHRSADILAGRKTEGLLSGRMLVAKRFPTQMFMRRHCGYVEQFGACALPVRDSASHGCVFAITCAQGICVSFWRLARRHTH